MQCTVNVAYVSRVSQTIHVSQVAGNLNPDTLNSITRYLVIAVVELPMSVPVLIAVPFSSSSSSNMLTRCAPARRLPILHGLP